jgi:D-glycero-D-manno-heptose 1,7-bisphosphate phosphatase
MRPAVFLDRDGTINVDHGYVHRIADVQLIEGAAEAIAALNRAGFLVIVVTNQSGVARGLYTQEDVERVHAHLRVLLEAGGGHVDAFYYCPYHPEGQGAYRQDSPLRKPAIGMFELARRDFELDAERSWMVGDKLEDMLFAERAGLQGILVKTGEGARVLKHHSIPPRVFVADSIVQAVDRIVG